MRRVLFVIFAVIFSFSAYAAVAANSNAATNVTALEEAEGRQVWKKLQTKQVSCANLSTEDYEVLGEYFMGLMLGDAESHEAMNRMMTIRMGQQGEEQMHVVMGKRFSGCDTSAAIPFQGSQYGTSMMGAMGPWMMFGTSGYGAPYGMIDFMSGSWYWTGWITQLLTWTVLVLAVIALATWLKRQGKK